MLFLSEHAAMYFYRSNHVCKY